jgi:hypothetical protein
MCGLGIAILILIPIIALANTEWRDHVMFGGLQVDGGPPLQLTERTRWILISGAVPSLLCQIYALWCGIVLFQGYRMGEVFTAAAGGRLQLIGWAIFAMAPLGVLTKLTIGWLLSSETNSGGGISLALSIGDFDFGAVAFGLLAVLIGRVLKEAALLSAEHRMFV